MRQKVTKVFLRGDSDARFSAVMLSPDGLTIKDCYKQIELELVGYAGAKISDYDADLEMLAKLAAVVKQAIRQQRAAKRRAQKTHGE